jgi:ribose transport system ATP-binding protein
LETTVLLEMRDITKAFGGIEVLHGVSVDLQAGEIHALVGENGAGKSTLAKILSGIYPDYSGAVIVDGRPVRLASPRQASHAGIAVIQQEISLVRELTVAENIFLGREPLQWGVTVDYQEMNRRAALVLDELGSPLDPAQRLSDLRIGAQQMVEIARALSLDAQVLVMDEPTSALSETEIEHLFGVVRRLAARGVGIFYISHRFEEIFKLADRVTVMRDGAYVATKALAATSREELIRLMVGRTLETFFTRHGRPREEVAMSVKGLTLAAPGHRAQRLLENINFDVRAGEILGVAGLLGSGRSELLESLFGAYGALACGEVTVGGSPMAMDRIAGSIQHGLALVTEDRMHSGLVLGMSLGDNLSLAVLPQRSLRTARKARNSQDGTVNHKGHGGSRIPAGSPPRPCASAAVPVFSSLLRWGMISRGRQSELSDTYIRRMAIRCVDDSQEAGTLSGGNQQKVVLGKWLATNPRVLLLDEPTRGIDVGAKSEIYRLLAELTASGCAIVMASSEMPELLNLCDRILVLRSGRVSAMFQRGEATQERILEAAAPEDRLKTGG